MQFLMDPSDVKEVEGPQLEIDPVLLLRTDHLSWLVNLITSISMLPSNQSFNFCIACNRSLTPDEQGTSHRHQNLSTDPQHLVPLIPVHYRDNGMGVGDYYVSVQALREIQVPIGDVQSQVLLHPQPRLPRGNAAGNSVGRCLYIYPQNSKEEMWQGEMLSGRCAFRHCDRIFNNRRTHLRLYGITPQYCSISCKINTWLCCNN